VHLYSRFLRKTRSNRGSPQRSAPEREHTRAATSPARHATLCRAVRAVQSALAPTRVFPRLAPPKVTYPEAARTEAPRGWHPPRAATALASCVLPSGQAACPRSGPPLARRDASSERTDAYKTGCRPPCVRSRSTAYPEPPQAPVEATTASLGSGRPKPPASAPTALPCTAPFSHRTAPRRELAAAAATIAVRRCAQPPAAPHPQSRPKANASRP
jgi:hypothetical protein